MSGHKKNTQTSDQPSPKPEKLSMFSNRRGSSSTNPKAVAKKPKAKKPTYAELQAQLAELAAQNEELADGKAKLVAENYERKRKRPVTEFLGNCVGPYAGCGENIKSGSGKVDKYFSPSNVMKVPFKVMFYGEDKADQLAKRRVTRERFGQIQAMMYGILTGDEDGSTEDEDEGAEVALVLSCEADAAHLATKMTQSCNAAILVPKAVKKDHRLTTFLERTAGSTQGTKRTGDGTEIQSKGLRPDALQIQFMGKGKKMKPVYLIVGEYKFILELDDTWKTRDGKECREPVDVATMYHGEGARADQVKCAVNQLYSYMVVLCLRYGYLCTYNTWWFMKRTKDTMTVQLADGTESEVETGTETLYISEPIRVDGEAFTGGAAGGRVGFSLCEAYCYFALTAINDPLATNYEAAEEIMAKVKETYPDFPNDDKLEADQRTLKKSVITFLSRRSTDGGASGAAGSRQLQALVALVDKLPLSELPREPEYSETIARGRAGTVYKGRVEGVSFDVVIKIMDTIRTPDLEDEMKLEYRCYRRMVPLWGTVVPFCIWGGSMPNFRLGLVTSVAGEMQLGDWLLKKKIGVKYSTVATSLTDGLAQIHARGVVHGDVNTRNIMIDDDGSGSVMFVDFGCSTLLEADGSNTAVFEAQKQEDLKCLATVLDIVKDYTSEHVEPSSSRATKRVSLRIT